MTGVILIILMLAVYFLPAIIAAMKEHHNFVAILILNVFLGWTLIGWVGALVWSVMKKG